MDTLFKPFFTCKSSGLGFDLLYSKNVVEAHGSMIHIDSMIDEGK